MAVSASVLCASVRIANHGGLQKPVAIRGEQSGVRPKIRLVSKSECDGICVLTVANGYFHREKH